MNCGKCHGSFEKEGRDPLLLPSCGHTLCRACLRLFTQHNGFKCPFCGTKQPPKITLTDLLPNFALLQMMEQLTDENGRGGRKRDRNKSGTGATARERERSIQRNSESECIEHEGVRLTYWCGPCGVAVCGECVVEKHTGGGGGGGRRHLAMRIDAALKMRRTELEDRVCEVTRAIDAAEQKHTNLTKSSPFILEAKKLHYEVAAVMGKMKIVMSLLSRLVQESEDGHVGLQQLRQEMDQLIQRVPLSGSATGSVTEIRALLQHLKCLEEFRDGPVAKVVKEMDIFGREDKQRYLAAACLHTAALNTKGAALCKQVAWCGDGCFLEVVGGSGLIGSLTWDQNKLHLHCLRRSSPSEPRRPPSDPGRRHGLKWPVIQTQLQDLSQVFLLLAWGRHGQGGAGKEQVYFKLYRRDPATTLTSTSTEITSCRRFLHLLLGDEENGGSDSNSLLGPLAGDVQELGGARVILLGTHHQEEEKNAEKKSEEGAAEGATSNKTDPHVTPTGAPQVFIAAGDVICVKGRQSEGEAEFWLVTEGTTRITKPLAACEVVAALLPAHKDLLAKLPSLKGVKVEDCGAVLCSNDKEVREVAAAAPAPSARVSPSVHTKNGVEGGQKQKHQRYAVSYNCLDEIS